MKYGSLMNGGVLLLDDVAATATTVSNSRYISNNNVQHISTQYRPEKSFLNSKRHMWVTLGLVSKWTLTR